MKADEDDVTGSSTMAAITRNVVTTSEVVWTSRNFNYSMARDLLSMERPMELIKMCDIELAREPENVAILRLRAEASGMLGKWSSAHDDLFLVVKITSCDKKAMEDLKFIGNKLRQINGVKKTELALEKMKSTLLMTNFKSISKKLLAPGYRPDTLISWRYDPLNSDSLGVQMAQALGEREASMVTGIVEKLGASKAMELLEQTRATEAEGGLMLVVGSRRRTPGETFALLCKNASTSMPTGSHGVQNSEEAAVTADNKIKKVDVCCIEDGGDNNSEEAAVTAENKIKKVDVCCIEDGGDNNSEEAAVTAENKIKKVDVCCIEDGGDNALMPEQLEDIFAKIRENPGCLVDYADCPQVMSMLMERGVLSSSSESTYS